jgi:serine/threonine-protein phosphatase 4 catalytic subunit
LREGEVKALCLRAREILVDESNVQRVDAPVTVSQEVLVLLWTSWSEMK